MDLKKLHPTHVLRYTHSKLRRVYQPILNQRIERRFQAFAVGLQRCGTHSMHFIFQKNYRSAHEPSIIHTCELMYDRVHGGMDEKTFERRWLSRDRFLWLEMESNNIPTIIAPTLARLFPEAKFVLLLRDPYSWLHSLWAVQHWFTPISQHPRWYQKMMAYMYGYGRMEYGAGDQNLKQIGLPPLRGYLQHWRRMYDLGLNELPADRRLILYTHQLTNKLPDIAQFLDVPLDTLDQDNTHGDPAKDKRPFIFQIDRAYLEDQVHEICDPVLSQWFPTIKRLEDAVKPMASTATPPAAAAS
ncbi:MAG: sulfotransferase [Chloroflexota bacterium]|nr:sulfotransferase [Chloroflexota bacterium]